MTQQDPSPDIANRPDPIVELVSRCQAAYTAWATAEEPERNALSEAYRLLLEELWTLLADDLRHITRGWIRSNMAPDAESLALNMFGNIVFSLPKLQIDPQRNVRNLLLTIARRGLIDDYRRSHPSSPQRQATHAASIDNQPELIDPESAQIEDRTVRRLDGVALLKAVWHYWRNSLIPVEYEIMKLRWRSDPPSPFSDIAAQLGPGWEEAAVRQRHHRIMDKTRKYLRANGLIDENADL
jgi:DNA-directed RNA polymerase specialized sigma24 family protein